MGRKKEEKYRKVLKSELEARNKRKAREIWNTILPEIAEEDEEGTIASVIEANLPYVIEATAMALDLLQPDPRGGMGTIVVRTFKGSKKREEHGVKLRFENMETVEAIERAENGERRYKRGIWLFQGWDIYRKKEGWKFQFEIDLTERPKLIRNFFKTEVMSLEVWSA